jgi:glutathione S-transferase
MKLYSNSFGPFPRRVGIYLKESPVPTLDVIEIDLLSGVHKAPEFLRKNPAGTVPVLQLDTGECVTQSLAILEYFEESRGAPFLGGTNCRQRAWIRTVSRWADDAGEYFAIFLRNSHPLFAASNASASPQIAGWAYSQYEVALDRLESALRSTVWLAGRSVSIADFILFASAQFYRNAYRTALPVRFRRLMGWYERFSERPSAAAPVLPTLFESVAPASIPGCSCEKGL